MFVRLILSLFFILSNQLIADDHFFSDVKKYRKDFSFKAENKTHVSGTRLSKGAIKKSPCVLMLHGFSETKEYFELFGKHLFNENFNVFMVNLPDHGLKGSRSISSPLAGGFDDLMVFCKSTIDKIYKTCGNRPINIVTHSMGGMSCIDNYLNGGAHKVNGKMILDPKEAKAAAKKVNKVIAGAPPAEFEINHHRWPILKITKSISMEKFKGAVVNIPLSLSELKIGLKPFDDKINQFKDYILRKSSIINNSIKGLGSFSDLEPGEAVEFEQKTNRVGHKLIQKVFPFYDDRAKEYINRTDEVKFFDINWKDGTKHSFIVKPGEMLIWHKNENDKWILDVLPAPDYVLNEKYPNPYLREGQISSYRSEDGRIIYAGIPANENVDILYIAGEKDRLADGALIERKVKNSKSKKVSFLMMKDTDHLNLMFGKRSLKILADTMVSYLKTGLSKRTVQLIDRNTHLELNTNDPRHQATHHKMPKIQNIIDDPSSINSSCGEKHYLTHLKNILSKLVGKK